ncbi:MAG TPA: hypothetical protein V6D29_12345 [Leptolyngbyaceae cyanobacterium]
MVPTNDETTAGNNGNGVSSTTQEVPDENIAAKNQVLTKVAIGALVGAALGGIAGALTNRAVVDRINRSVRSVGDTVKNTTTEIDNTIKGVGDAVQSVAAGVNSTAKEINDAVRGTAEGISGTVKSTVHTVQDTADDIQGSVDSTVHTLKAVVGETSEAAQQVTSSEDTTLYKLIPVSANKSET